jgi:hypothetical protein
VRSLIPLDAVPSARSAGIGERTSAVCPIMRDVLLASSSRAQPDGANMSIHDVPPEDGKTTRPKTTKPMREALDAELRRER